MMCLGPSIKYAALFWTNFDPYPVAHLGTLSESTSHVSDNFAVVHAYIYMSLQGGLSLFAGVLSRVVYEKNEICDVTCSWIPLSQTVTPSVTPSPLKQLLTLFRLL